MEYAHVCRKAGGNEREHGLGEPAQAGDDPVGGGGVSGRSEARHAPSILALRG